MFKKMVSVMLAGAMVISLAACGGGNAGGESGSQSGADSGSEAEGEESGNEGGSSEAGGSISLWTWSPVTRTAEKMIAAFEKENSDIKIDYTNYNYNPEYLEAISAASSADNLPDIMGLQPGSLTQTYSDYLIDLGEYAKKEWGDDWTSVYDNVTQSQLQLGNEEGDDSYYILPIETQVIYIEIGRASCRERV